MNRDIKQLIADYNAYVKEHPHDTDAQLYASEIKEIWDTGKAVNGDFDPALAICNGFAVVYMLAAKRYGKEG